MRQERRQPQGAQATNGPSLALRASGNVAAPIAARAESCFASRAAGSGSHELVAAWATMQQPSPMSRRSVGNSDPRAWK
jgi:hypothetical protein